MRSLAQRAGREGSPLHPAGYVDPLANVDARSASAVERVFRSAAEANRSARCRQGSIDVVEPKGELIATGDLHDNPVHFAIVDHMARLDVQETKARPHRRLTLHEVIHSDRLVGGVDLSHRALLRVAALKVAEPEMVHTLLANHELAQVVGAGIAKNGVRVVEAFNAGVEYVFGDEAPGVIDAIDAFIRSMPLAVVSARATDRAVLCAHSLPAPEMMDRFDLGVLDRELTEEDYEARRGSAHLMVWGRRHTPEQLESLARSWGVGLFILGHQHVEEGWRTEEPNAVILNSDHDRGVAMLVDLADPPALADVGKRIVRLSEAEV